MSNLEYMLRLWREKPENIADPGVYSWKVHVKNAQVIPRIGELLASGSGDGDEYTDYKVFNVVHMIPGIWCPTTQGMKRDAERTIKEGEDGLVIVWAYVLHY